MNQHRRHSASSLHPRNWTAVVKIGIGRLLALLPTAAGLTVGRWLGRTALRLLPSRRLVVETNIRACFPELSQTERRVLVGSNFAATGCGLVEVARALWADRESLLAGSEVTGLENLGAAYQGGRGVVVLLAHFTCVELACRLLNEHASRPVYMLVRRHNNPYLEHRIDAERRAHCERTFEKKELVGVRRALKNNRAVFYAPDQNFTYRSVFAPFFGIPAATVTATADLVGRSGAALVPFWAWRDDNGRYHLAIEPAWEDFPSGDPVADAARVNAWIESRVREHPAQYLWAHRRFRTRPKGEPPFYPARSDRRKRR